MGRLVLLLAVLLYTSVSHAGYDLMVYNNPPLIEVRMGEKPVGRAVNLIEALFARINLSHEFVQMPLRRALYHTLDKHNHDEEDHNICIFPVERTQEREPRFHWVGPISVNRYLFFASADRPVSMVTLADAKDLNIAVFAGTGISEYLIQSGFKVFETDKLEQGLQMLQHGRTDLWVADAYSAQNLTQKYDQIELQPVLSFFTTINFMACDIHMDENEYRLLNRELKKMYASGQAQQLLELNF